MFKGGNQSNNVDAPTVNLEQQTQDAREAGIAEVCRLLAAPEDLARLEQLRAEVASKLSSARSTLSSSTAAHVDAARYGLQLLDKSHRHIAKLRLCIDRIDELCEECATLVENHDKIRALSHAHRNVAQVLEELGDIIDLPIRAAAVEELMSAGDGGMVAAFEGLTVLEGTANNIKEAWRRNAKKSSDLGELAEYLTQVGETMTSFERRLWSLARDYHLLAQRQPRMLVDVARVVEMQEQMDAHYTATKATYVRPRHYRERLMLEMEAAVRQHFAPLLALCAHQGQPNAKVKYDQDGNRVLSETRDYLGALIDIERCDAKGNRMQGATDAELAVMQIHEEDIFDEDVWLETLLGGCTALEGELAEAYDYVSPCFPPRYTIFDTIFQMYHVQFAQAIDIVGQVSDKLSTAGQLRLMQWVVSYQQTLRGLGVQEELVRLPVAPMSSEAQPGFAMLIESYTDRMEVTMTAWFKAILAQDLASQPQQMTDGTLRTPGVIDFFRILNEQVAVLEEISRGEVLLAAAARSLKLMRDFVAAQQELLKPGGVAALLAAAASASAAAAAGGAGGVSATGPPAGAAPSPLSKGAAAAPELSFEMVAALLNNSVDCYNQSLEFTEHVQSLLDEGFRRELDVEDTCRAFLDLARAWAQRLVDIMYADAGLVEQWRRMYSSADWLSGKTCATLLATIGDYFTDINTFVEPGFCRRVCEMALEEHVRRASSAAVAAFDRGTAAAVAAMGSGAIAAAVAALGGNSGTDADDLVLARLAQEEKDVQLFFEPFLPRDRLSKRLQQFAGLRDLLDSRDPEPIVLGYETVLELNPAITPAMVEKMLTNRVGLTKAQVAEIAGQCRELYAKAMQKQGGQATGAAAAATAAAVTAAAGGPSPEPGGKKWKKFWGRS